MDLPNRNIDLANTPPLDLSNGSAPPQANPQTVNQFNTAVQGLLKQYQTMGTKPFAVQGFDAQQVQNNRISAAPTPDMVGASPGQQNSVRTSSAQAVQPTISGAQNSQQTFGEQLNSFGNSIKDAQSFMQSYQTSQTQQKSQAQALIHDTISGGSDALAALIQSQPDLVKLAGYSPETLQGVVAGLRKTEQQSADSKKQFTSIDLGDKIGIFDEKGNMVSSQPKGQSPGTATNTPKIIGSASGGYYTVNPDGTVAPLKTGGVANSAAFPNVDLAPGQISADVSKLQTALGIPVTGAYDQATTDAVLALQQKLGIDYSSGPGIFGPRTKAAVQGKTYTPPKAKTPVVTDAQIGDELKQAQTAIAGGADSTAARQLFLSRHPSKASQWDAYFKTSSGTGVSNPF